MPAEARPQPPAGRVRATRQAAAIEEVLRGQDGFRSAQELFAVLRARGDRVGLTTVYRYLNLLAEQGRADVVSHPDGEAQFRLCGTGATPAGRPVGRSAGHHHHLVCRRCGRSVEVVGPQVEDWAEQVASAHGYTEVTHTVEVFGLCPEHSTPAGARAPVAGQSPTPGCTAPADDVRP